MRFAVDSRLVEPQGTFFALKGARTDGHLYLREVALRGAHRAYVADSYEGEDFGMELVRVKDPLLALQKLAQERLEEGSPFVIGVTGSFAKTTTKEGVFAALKGFVRSFKTPMNANSQVGLPLAILNGYRGERVAILEMGIEFKGEMGRLTDMVRPDFAVITRIGQAHVETLGSIEEIAREKGGVIDKVKTKVAFLHHSVLPFKDFFPKGNYEIEVYGGPSEPLFEDIVDLGCRLQRRLGFLETRVEVPGVALRFEKVVHPKGMVILDCYNANPESMCTFFRAQKQIPWEGRRVAIIGEMVGLGEQSDMLHLSLLEEIAPTFDTALVVGDRAKGLYESLKGVGKGAFFAQNLEELKTLIQNEVIPHDLVLVKGSNSNRLWEIAPCLQQILST